MEYTEYRVDVLALCNFAEQAQADLARVTAERDKEHATATKALEIYTMAEDEGDALRARVAEVEVQAERYRLTTLRQDATIAELTTDGNAATLAVNLAKASKRNAELVAALRELYARFKNIPDGCDHSVGICWCPEIRALDNAAKALACAESATPAKQEVSP